MYADGLDLATDAYACARAADGYSSAEDLSGKNKAGIALAAMGLGLLGLVKVAQHGRDMDEEAARLASKYQGVSADQAEHVMRRLAGTFAIDDDPAELARQADAVLYEATAHGYSGGQLAFILDHAMDKGMSASEAVAYMTAGSAQDVLAAAYREVGQGIIYQAVKDASSIDSQHDAESFAGQLNDRLIAEGCRQTPYDVAQLIRDIGGADDVTTRSGELISAYGILSDASARTGATVQQGVDVMKAVDAAEDYDGDSVISLANGAARLLSTAREHSIPFGDISSTIKGIDRASDYSERADGLIDGALRLLDARGRYGASHEDALGLLNEVDRASDYSEHASDLVASTVRLIESCGRTGVPYQGAMSLVKAIDKASDYSEHATDLVTGATSLMEACRTYGVPHDEALSLVSALDKASDYSEHAADLASGAVKLIEACRSHGVGIPDAASLVKGLDDASDVSDHSADLASGAVRLMEGMAAAKASIGAVMGLVKEADRDGSSQDAPALADAVLKRMGR